MSTAQVDGTTIMVMQNHLLYEMQIDGDQNPEETSRRSPAHSEQGRWGGLPFHDGWLDRTASSAGWC